MTNLKPEMNARVAVIGKRYNPQLGSYIVGPHIGEIVRVRKTSFSVKFDKPSDNEYYPKTFDFYGNSRSRINCVYGSMSYEAHTIPEAIEILESTIPRYPADSPKVKQLHDTIEKLRALTC